MWIDCEKNSDVIWYCESQCERNSSHIVTHIVRRLWGNCEWRWIPLISVFVYICPPHCERNSAHIVRTFPSSFRCVFDIVAHNVAGKSKILQYVGVRSFSQFLIIFIVHSIQFFIVSSKISKFLKLDQNWRF